MSKVSAEFVEHHVEHHFDTAHQEFSSAKLGMWLFLGQEILFFSALFVAYAVYRYLHPEMFLDANGMEGLLAGPYGAQVSISSGTPDISFFNSDNINQAPTPTADPANNNLVTFNQNNWDETQEIRIRYDTYEDLPEVLEIGFENVSQSDDLKNISIAGMSSNSIYGGMLGSVAYLEGQLKPLQIGLEIIL